MLDRRVSGSHKDIKAAIMVRIPSITRGKVTDTPGNWAYKPTKTQSNELRCQRRLETIKKLEYSWLSLICNFECYDNTRKQTLCWESYHEAQTSGKLKRKLSASNLQRKPAEYDRLLFTYLTPRNGTMYNLKITVTMSKERLTRLKSEFPLGLLKISSHQQIQFIKCLVCAAKCDWQYAMYGLERPNSSHEKTMNISWGKIYSAMFLLFPMVQLTSAMMKGTTMPPIREKVEQVPRAIFLQKNINYLDATVSETFWRKTKGFFALQRKMRDITTCFFKAEGLKLLSRTSKALQISSEIFEQLTFIIRDYGSDYLMVVGYNSLLYKYTFENEADPKNRPISANAVIKPFRSIWTKGTMPIIKLYFSIS